MDMKRYILLLGLFPFLLFSCNSPQDRLAAEINVPVWVMELNPEPMERNVSITGTVKPIKEAQLKAQIAGKYKLHKNPATNNPFTLGDYVREGQEIIILENKEYETGIRLSSLNLNLEITSQTYEKQQSLHEKGGVTLSELKQAEINFINAKYAYDDALIKMEKIRVKAPFSGIIVDLPNYTPGIELEAGKDLVKIMDYGQMIMDVNFSENSMVDVRVGLPVRVMNYMIPEQTLTGYIARISPAIDPDTRSFKGNIIIQNPDLLLRPGMYAKGDIIIEKSDSSIVVPRHIIQSRGSENVLFVVDNGFAFERAVAVGIENTEKVQIVSGLQFSDRVVYRGYETLRDKTKVKINQ
jgi:membrane fusion protein, multidrug efflux system